MDFCSASLYHAMGIPVEQDDDNGLIRPRADYTGPAERAYTGGR